MTEAQLSALQAENRALKEALLVAANALDIAADWHFPVVQCNPPKVWGLEARGEDPEEGWCSTSALAAKLRALVYDVNPVPAQQDYFKHACWLALQRECAQYLIANSHGRRDGAMKAHWHMELCKFYTSVANGGSDPDYIRREHEEVYQRVHNHTQQLTDRLDEVIGFPLKERPDYDVMLPRFFEHFHRLALEALGVAPQ